MSFLFSSKCPGCGQRWIFSHECPKASDTDAANQDKGVPFAERTHHHHHEHEGFGGDIEYEDDDGDNDSDGDGDGGDGD